MFPRPTPMANPRMHPTNTVKPLWIALHLPQLAVEVFHPNLPYLGDQKTKAVVICDANRVIARSAHAAQCGISIGMRHSSIGLLCEHALIHARAPQQEQERLQQLAFALLQYTPQVCINPYAPASLLLSIGASLSLFGGIRHLLKRIKSNLASFGLSSNYGIAPYAGAASLLAQNVSLRHAGKISRTQFCLKTTRLAQRLDRLAVYLLPHSEHHLEWLHGIGCHHLSSLRDLPRAGLQRRCGKDLLHALDIAYGTVPEMHQWVEMPKEFKARAELPDRIEHTEAILHFAEILLLQLCGWLQQQQLAVKQIHLSLEHERGRQAVPPTILKIFLTTASWQADHLKLLLKEHLTQLTLPAPVIILHLHAPQVEAMQAPSQFLFPEMHDAQDDHAKLIELLVARLGADNVLQADPIADYRPEFANHWVSVLKKPKKKNDALRFHNPRPIWLLAQEQALHVHQHSPYYGSRLQLISPAERIEAGWWNGQLVTRDYFIAECKQHIRYWIYRERIGATSSHDEALWYLHGVFG